MAEYSEELAWFVYSNGTSSISKSQWSQSVWPQWVPSKSGEKVSAGSSFAYVDADGDGGISHGEFMHGYKLSTLPAPAPTQPPPTPAPTPTSTEAPATTSTLTTTCTSTSSATTTSTSGTAAVALAPGRAASSGLGGGHRGREEPEAAGQADEAGSGKTAQCPAGLYRSSEIVWACRTCASLRPPRWR